MKLADVIKELSALKRKHGTELEVVAFDPDLGAEAPVESLYASPSRGKVCLTLADGNASHTMRPEVSVSSMTTEQRADLKAKLATYDAPKPETAKK